MKQILSLFILTSLYGCFSDNRLKEVFKTDSDFAEFWRRPSPDSSMLLLNYGIDLGAFDYSHAGTAILKPSDTLKNLRLFTLSNQFDVVKWIDSKTVSAGFDTVPYVRKGQSSIYRDTIINGVIVRFRGYDHIESDSRRIIEHQETSPNGKFELVAYRYVNDEHNLNFIHVSVIPVGGQIPTYGNFLIGDMISDYVLNGKWEKDNTLVFYSNKNYADLVKYYLVKYRPDINYVVINDDKTYGMSYLWTAKSSR